MMTSTNQQQIDEQFTKLREEYDSLRSAIEAKPLGDHKGGFNSAAHKHKMIYTAKGDLLLAQMIMMKQEDIKFATVDESKGKYCFVFNPYGDYLDKLESMTYDIIPTLALKPKAIKTYQKACSSKIVWLTKIMTGPIADFFAYRLDKWIKGDAWKGKKKDFGRDVAMVMKLNPHIQCQKYATYIKSFIEWISVFEDDDIAIVEVLQHVMENLKMVFYKDEQAKYTSDGTINARIEATLCYPSWQSASDTCNRFFSAMDFAIQEDISFIEMFKRRAQEKLAEKEAKKQGKPVLALKRKAESEPKGREPPKRLRIENTQPTLGPAKGFDDVTGNGEENGEDDLEAFKAFQREKKLAAERAAQAAQLAEVARVAEQAVANVQATLKQAEKSAEAQKEEEDEDASEDASAEAPQHDAEDVD